MTPKDGLKRFFQLDDFREPQESVVEAILEGRDVLVVMPTGGGKSLCYQLPAMLKEGVALVISPLISLMQDQVEGLRARGIPATFINSSLGLEEQKKRVAGVRAGEYKLLYIAPERLRNEYFLSVLKDITISFVAIDEAHCISQWGHDFRPDYMRVADAMRLLGNPQMTAFTATATPTVQDDIVKSLKMNDPVRFVSGFTRKNLELRIIRTAKEAEKFAHLEKLIEEQKTGIIYCATRKRVEKVAEYLKALDYSLVMYHAGMSDDERERVQQVFMEGKADIAVATNAFGMGIDRSDIRFVVHFEIPGSLEAYYQEVGRAGRDGEKSVCELYYNYADKRVQEFFLEGANPSKETIQSVFRQLQMEADNGYEVHLSVDDLAERMGKGTNPMAVGTSLAVLSRGGCIERFDIPGKRMKGTRLVQPDISPYQLPVDYITLREKANRDNQKLETMLNFADSVGCRQKWILNYFGEKAKEGCGSCDGCKGDGGEQRVGSEEEVLILKKALSGVARMSYYSEYDGWIARFGKTKIIQMLLGSDDRAMKQSGLNELSTYGILQEVGLGYVNKLFREMERMGLVESVKRENYALMTLTDRGQAVMQGKMDCEMVWPEVKTAGRAGGGKPKTAKQERDIERKNGVGVPEGFDPVLYELLRQTRVDLAKKRRNARLFMILSNKSLEHLAAVKPRSIEEAREIPGIGPAKASTVLPAFIEVIRGYGGQGWTA